jgi:CheY-like chemotaxis protein
MLDHEDLKWIATTSTELNGMLQQIARYADLARQHKGEHSYVEMLGDRVELASKTAQALFDHVTNRILAGSSERAASAGNSHSTPSNVVPMPTPKTKKPAARPAAQQKRPASQPTVIPSEIKVLNRKGSRELILLVEDEVEIAQLAAEMLTDQGYRVIIAHDGFEALRIYQQISNQIGLVILDFFLPVMDGDAVFDELRALNPNAAVVLSSGFAEQSKLGNMLAQGLRGFIPKPYRREKLLEQVRSTLDATRQAAR